MINRLIEMYESGAITGYQVMMDCLQMLDPNNPDLALSDLPEEILNEMLEYARRYDPRRPHSASLTPPAEDQVRTAEHWIRAHRTSVPSRRIDDAPGGISRFGVAAGVGPRAGGRRAGRLRIGRSQDSREPDGRAAAPAGKPK